MTDEGPALIERLPDGVVVVRAGTVVVANARARTLLGLDPVGRAATEVLTFVNDAGRAVPLPSGPPPVGDRYAEQVLHLAVRGGIRPLACSAAWVDGDLVITLRSAGRREAAGRSQADVVATVAHELRAPLTSVKGFTRTLLSRWDRFSDEQKHTMLQTIEADADRVTRLLSDLLDVARIEAGRVKLRRTEVDVVELVQQVVDKAQVRAPDAVIEAKVEGTVAPVPADADKLEQIVTNLVDNAIQHAPGSPVRCTVSDRDGVVRVSVVDEGAGVPWELVPQLFTKFGRGRHDHRVGTGLGLFVAKGLVEAHGGRIFFDDDVEVGATVHVELPRNGNGAATA